MERINIHILESQFREIKRLVYESSLTDDYPKLTMTQICRNAIEKEIAFLNSQRDKINAITTA